MILLDALYINNSGGKVLLDYLITTLEHGEVEVHYLLDQRIEGDHPAVNNKVTYLPASLLSRHRFYKTLDVRYATVLCFGNLPPTVSMTGKVYTYFHQKLFLEIPQNLDFKSKCIFKLKKGILKFLAGNTDFWLVQSQVMKLGLLDRSIAKKKDTVNLMPFFPSIPKAEAIVRSSTNYCYVSSGSEHKNHFRLIEAFILFSETAKDAVLELTVGKEFVELCSFIDDQIQKGYAIVNHGTVQRQELAPIYTRCKFLVFPSLSESFGLGIVEALEFDCKVIGANLPYMHEVCEPSITFNPLSVDSIYNGFHSSTLIQIPPSKAKITNQIDQLISLLMKPIHENK
jgi:glycosyltransferase involved in cell wall biosynthesis